MYEVPYTRHPVPLAINIIHCSGTLVTMDESTLIPKHSLKPTLYSDLFAFYLRGPFLCSSIPSRILLYLRSSHLLRLLWTVIDFQTFLVFDDFDGFHKHWSGTLYNAPLLEFVVLSQLVYS